MRIVKVEFKKIGGLHKCIDVGKVPLNQAIKDYDDNNKMIITDQTPFYAESGGQVGDIGYLIDNRGNKFNIVNTLKFLGKIHAHICKVNSVDIDQAVTLQIDVNHRNLVESYINKIFDSKDPELVADILRAVDKIAKKSKDSTG